MRKVIVLLAALAAAIGTLVAVAPSSSANTVTVTIGDGIYTVGFQPGPPSGTLSIGGGTIAARCGAASVRGGSITPTCTTRTIPCPATASSCDMTIQARDGALSGPANWFGSIVGSGSYVTAIVPQPYHCAPPNSSACTERVVLVGVSPGSNFGVFIVNTDSNHYDTVTISASMAVH